MTARECYGCLESEAIFDGSLSGSDAAEGFRVSNGFILALSHFRGSEDSECEEGDALVAPTTRCRVRLVSSTMGFFAFTLSVCVSLVRKLRALDERSPTSDVALGLSSTRPKTVYLNRRYPYLSQ